MLQIPDNNEHSAFIEYDLDYPQDIKIKKHKTCDYVRTYISLMLFLLLII